MPQETFTKAQFWSELDAHGEDEVLVRLRVTKQWGDSPLGEKHALALLWLKDKEDKRAVSASARRDAMEEETLSIAREALANSRRANQIAITAAILATTATIIAAIIGVMYASPK